MRIEKNALILLMGILLVVACTCSSSTEPEPVLPTADVQIVTANLNCQEISEGFFKCKCHLTGTVKNIGDKDAGYVVVKAEFLDAYGVKLHDGLDLAVDLLTVGASVSYSIEDNEIEQCPSTYEVWAEWGEPPEESEGCFIATAAYGTEAAAEIDVLRKFRDEVLLESALGSQVVEWYYQTSPPVADFISENNLLRTIVRELVIDPMVTVATFTQGMWGK